MSKMFVHYSGNKAAFAAATNTEGTLLSKVYENHIVFIKGETGECIYTHGQYYGDVKAAIAVLEGRMNTAEGKISANETAIKANDDAIKALKYFSQIKVGDKTAVAANKEGTITFEAVNPQEVSIDVDAHGLTFGLSEAFTTKVDTAASQAAAAAVKTEVDASIQALENADSGLGDRIATIEASLGIEGEGQDGIGARLTTAEGDIDALEGLMSGNAEGSVNARIEAAKGVAAADATSKANAAEASAKGHADSLNTAMNTRMESAEGSIATLTGSGDGSVAKALVDAKAYADGLVAEGSALEGRVKANEDAIGVLNGAGDGSVKKQVADAIAGVVASAPEDFDTLKEVADWIASDTTGAAKMQADIATLKGDDTTEGSVAKTVKDAVAAEAAIARAAEQANADAIDAIEADYLKASDKTELSNKITALEEAHTADEETTAQALTDLNNKYNELSETVEANVTAAQTYTNEAIAALDVTDEAVANQFVTAVSETDGKIAVSRSAITASQISITNTEDDAFDAATANVQDALTELASFWAWEEL